MDLRRGDGPEGARHYNFAALTTTEAFIMKEPEVAAAAVRAIKATQNALRENPSLAKVVGNEVFPGGDEVEIMPTLIARDAPFYDPTITLEAVKGLNDFAMANKLITQPLAFEDIVASQFKHLWSKSSAASLAQGHDHGARDANRSFREISGRLQAT